MPEAALKRQQQADLLDQPPPGWISAIYAASLCAVDARTVRRWVAAGRVDGRLVRDRTGVAYYVDPLTHPLLAAHPQLAAELGDALPGGSGRALAALPAQRRAKVAVRLAAIRSWLRFRDRLDGGEKVQQAFARWTAGYARDNDRAKSISWTTMWRWETTLREEGMAALAPVPGGPGGSEPGPQAWAFFQTLYLTTNKRTIRDCWRQTRAQAARKRWPWPSYAVIARKVGRDIPHATKVLHREGRKAHEDQCVPFVQRDYEGLAPNDWWVVDHHQLDIAAIGPNGRPVFPWITLWQDVKSRRPMGVMLHFGPKLDVVLASLRRALLIYGVPANLLFDNGKEFRARQFTGGRRKKIRYETDPTRVRAALHALPVEVHFAQPFNAKSKPNERTFLTIRRQFSKQWHGYRGNNPQNRPEGVDQVIADYRDNGLIPKAADLEAALVDWLENVYCKNVHRGQGMNGRSPEQVYEGELRQVTRVSDDELILLMMRTTEPRLVRRNGIHLFGRWFNAPELFAYKGRKVYARFDPAQVGILYIHDLDDSLVCVAHRKDMLAWGASHADLRNAHRLKSQHRRAAAAYAETSELVTGDPLQNIALQRQAAEQDAAQRPAPPEPPAGEQRSLKLFRSVLADTAEQLGRLPVAVGGEGDTGRRVSASDFFGRSRTMNDVPDVAAPAPEGPAGQATDEEDEIFDDLDVS